MNMMIKIFGVLLIVSGSVVMGWVPSDSQRKRLERLIYIRNCLASFYRDLKQERRSIDSFFSEGADFLEEEANKWLLSEEQDIIRGMVAKIKTDSYSDALNRCGALVDQLSERIEDLQKTEEKNGKARPLVTGALGLLLAVLLF